MKLRVSGPDRPDCQSYTVHGIGNSQFVVTNHAENETSLATEYSRNLEIEQVKCIYNILARCQVWGRGTN